MTTSKNNKKKEYILVIKLSALGDFVQNFGIMRAIRNNHEDAEITLLTTPPYLSMAQDSGYFDEIWTDHRPRFYQPMRWFDLRKKLNSKKVTRVYDLQINDRTALYYNLFKKKPEWIGQLKKEKRNKEGLAFYRHKNILKEVGIKNIKIDQLTWMRSDISKFNIEKPYALIIPGCAPTRPEKRWPSDHYIELCQKLLSNNIQPVLIGTKDEEDVTDEIHKKTPKALNLNGETSLSDIVSMAREATIAIGNDTGPMHMIGPTNCPTLVLFSKYSDPERHRPLGQNVYTMQESKISDITPDSVFKTAKSLFR